MRPGLGDEWFGARLPPWEPSATNTGNCFAISSMRFPMASCSAGTSARSTSIPQESVCSAGRHPDDVLDRPVLDLFHAEHREVVTNAIERSLARRARTAADAKVVGLDGAARDVEVRATVLGDPAVSVALMSR